MERLVRLVGFWKMWFCLSGFRRTKEAHSPTCRLKAMTIKVKLKTGYRVYLA